MADRQVTVTISATDSFSSVVDKYKTAMQQADDVTKKVGESAEQNFGQKLNSSLKVVENSIGAVVAAYATFDQVMNAGSEVLRVNAAFEAMAGSAEQAKAGQEALAQSTRGLVDDEEAMAAATRLLSLGLADNVTQAAALVGAGAQLGRVMNGDAAGGMAAITNILATESPRALKQFGISVDDVQKKVKELTDSGVNAREAFRTVVTDEINDKLKEMGDNAVMAGSAWERLKIKAQDALEGIEASAAQGFENVSNLVDLLSSHPEKLGEALQQANAALQAGITGVAPGEGRAPERIAASRMPSIPTEPLPGMGETEQDATGVAAYQFYQANVQSAQTLQNVQAMQEALNEGAASQTDIATQTALETQHRQQNLDALHSAQNVLENISGYMQEQSDIFQTATSAEQQNMSALAQLDERRVNMSLQGRGSLNGTHLFTDEEAANARNIATSAQQIYDQISARAQQYPTLVSKEDVDNARNVAEQAGLFADGASRGAQAFDNMNLGDLLGQQSGGVAGQITDMITQRLQNQGMDADSIQRIVDQMDLTTGRQTEASEYLKNTLVPQLATIAENDGTAAAKMSEALDAYLKNAALTGQQVTQGGMALAMQPEAFGSGYDVLGGSSGGNAAGDAETKARDMATHLGEAADSSTKITDNTENIAANVATAATQTGAMQQAMSKIQQSTGGIRADIQALTAGTKTVQVALVVTAVNDHTGKFDGFIQALSGVNTAVAMAQSNGLRASQSSGLGQHAPGGGA